MLRKTGAKLFYSLLLFGFVVLYPLNHIAWAIANRKRISVTLTAPFVCLGLVIVFSYTNLLFGNVFGYIFLGMALWGPFVGSLFIILRMVLSIKVGPKQKYWFSVIFSVLQLAILFSLLAILARILNNSAQLGALSLAHGFVLSIIIIVWVTIGTLILLKFQEDALSEIGNRLAALNSKIKRTD